MMSQGKFIPKPQLPQGSAAQAEAEFKSKFPNTRLSSKDLLRRKVSSQGGKQYFDSGDYVMKKKLPGPSGGPAPQASSLLGVGTEVATVDNIPMRKSSQKAPIPITSPQRSSNLVSAPPITSSSQIDPHRDLSPMATNPPSNPLTRHHMSPDAHVSAHVPAHPPFHARSPPHTVTMKPPTVAPISLITAPPRSAPDADADDMV